MTLAIGNNIEILVFGDAGDAHYAELMRAWRWTNSLLQPKIKDIVATLPTGATEGDVYIVTGGSMPNQLARWTTRLSTAAWEYMPPKAGWEVRVQSRLDSAGLPKTYGYTGTAWVEKPGGSGGSGNTGGGTSSTGGDVYLTKATANGVLDLSATTANLWGVTLTSNVSTLTLPTTADYYSMSVIFTQDSTGGRTVAFPSSVKWTNGAVALNTAPSTTTILSFLTVDKGVTWFGFAAPATGSNSSLTNPMTSAGDLIVGGANGIPSRLPKGPDGSVLTMVNGALAWATSTSGSFVPMTVRSFVGAGGYTLLDADKNSFLRNTAAPGISIAITLPADAAWTGVEVAVQNTRGAFLQFNNGAVLPPAGRTTTCRKVGGVVRLKCVDEASWSISGDLDIDLENSAPQPSYVSTFGGDRTLALTDVGDTMLMNSSTAASLTVTIPPESSVAFPDSAEVHIIQFGTAPVLIAAGSGVNLYKPAGYNAKVAKRFGALTLKRITADGWVIIGMLEPAS